MPHMELAELFERHNIKATVNRLIVARALLNCERPLSLMELEERIGTIDKSGIFRCLLLFRKCHLVHAIEDGSDGTRYELCMSNDSLRDEDAHVHFFCEKCHRTFCLEDIHIPPVTLPEGYSGITTNYLVKGICPKCSDNHGKQ